MVLLQWTVAASLTLGAFAQSVPKPLLLKDSTQLLTPNYLKEERGYAKNSDGTYHIAMPGVTGAMIDWWFGYITTTEQYRLWHPIDHVYSEWAGPHGNSTYIGGNHLVYEKIGGQQQKLRINFGSPAVYFGNGYNVRFQASNVATAVCGRVGFWMGKGFGTSAMDFGHLIHLVHDEPGGVRMRSRFWLGDIGINIPAGIRASAVPINLVEGLVKHASEEMAYLAGFLPELYQKYHAVGPRRSSEKDVVPWTNE